MSFQCEKTHKNRVEAPLANSVQDVPESKSKYDKISEIPRRPSLGEVYRLGCRLP